MKTVSIIIPCYNAEKYIGRSILSALQQSYTQTEIIVINDGSTDNSLSEIQKIQDSRIKLINQTNQGAAKARNNGLQQATGDYIQFLDADDILDKDKILNQMKQLAGLGYPEKTITFAQWYRLTDKQELPSKNNQSIWHDYNSPIQLLLDMAIVGCCLPPIVYLTPKSLIEEAGMWDETLSLNDDGEFFARVIEKSERILFCGNAIAIYRSTSNSLSKRLSSKAALSEIRSLIQTADILKNKPLEHTDIAIKKMITSCLYSFYPRYRKQRIMGEKYLERLYPDITFHYPTLSCKEWMYYLYSCFKKS
ncbi:glycosyltransferase family 2 protein [uncultured Bacteroides sp.]|uniref:glycosyltransferase family 2 protein n=1 Tax=uncultured Bacteroides sp. TaxID=162156 RepID=UPI002635A2E6|nr:glycosyltransferase family 2 protein [uncultured Bacteroides sp.]